LPLLVKPIKQLKFFCEVIGTFACFSIPKVLNDMNIAVQKSFVGHLYANTPMEYKIYNLIVLARYGFKT